MSKKEKLTIDTRQAKPDNKVKNTDTIHDSETAKQVKEHNDIKNKNDKKKK